MKRINEDIEDGYSIKKSNEEELKSRRGKRRSYCFNYPAPLTTAALKSLLETTLAPNDKRKGERKNLVDHLEGAFVNEAENKLYVFFTAGKEPSYFKRYPFVIQNTIRKWIPRTKTFDSSIPPNDEDEFECWDFKGSKYDKLVEAVDACSAISEGEEEKDKFKLKRKKDIKKKEKSQEQDKNFSLAMYSKILNGQSFNSIFQQVLNAGDVEALQRLNRMSDELRALEFNQREALNLNH